MKIQNSAVAPATYNDFFDQYTSYVTGLVVKLGINPVDAQDVAQDILIVFFERDGLSLYDPERVSESTGERITFKTYVNVHVRAQIRKRLEKQYRRANNETSYDAEETAYLLDNERAPDGGFEDILTSVNLESLRAHLATKKPSPTAKITLEELFDAVLYTYAEMSRQSVRPNSIMLGEKIGIGHRTARLWLKTLEAEIRSWVESNELEMSW